MSRSVLKSLKTSLLGLLFILPFLLSSNTARATHVMGADITYKCIDSLKFKITVKYYRWCNGVSFGNPSSASRIRCVSGGGGSVGLTLTLDNIKEITPVCATATGECVPTNTYGTGEGIEQHTYTAIVDFNDSNGAFYGLRNCCKVLIETGQCCRNSNINTGAANANFYTYAEIDLCKAPCNSSPSLTSEPIAILCCNQPFFFNNGASDTSDFDSLSYQWAHPLSAFGTNIGYSGLWYAYNHPFKAHYPGTLTPPTAIPSASPPIGITLDPTTGDIIFTPTRCDEVTVAVIQVNEWRKDSTGTYQKIGVTRRDMQFITKTCPSNNPPIIDGPYSYSVCAGSSICFNITTQDPVFIPPPPATSPPPDSVKVTWNRGIPGATFSVVNPTARLQTGQFCWTPALNQASDLPYQFTVTARDNACPLNAVTVRAFRVKVKHRALAERNIDTLPCGEYSVESLPILGFRGTPSYRWEILDSNSNIVLNPKTARFRNGTFLSFSKQDTILFRRGGTYIIKHTVNNSPNNCPTIYLDTLFVPPLLEANLTLGPDTFICAGSVLRLEPYISNASPPITYTWATMGVDDDGEFLTNVSYNPADTLPYFDITVPAWAVDTGVYIRIQDSSGCFTEDLIQVFLKENPTAYLPEDARICTYDSVLLIPTFDTAYWVDPMTMDTIRQGDTLWKEWNHNGSLLNFSTADSVVVNEPGDYILKVYDSLGCFDHDTFHLYVNDTVTAYAGPDQTVCFNDTFYLQAQGLDTAGNGKSGLYRWYNITNLPRTFVGQATTYAIRAQNTTTYMLELFATEGGVQCYSDDTVTITVDPLPVISLSQIGEVCCDYGNISLNFNIQSAKGGTWTCETYPQLVVNNVFQTDAACGLIQAPARQLSTYLTYTYQHPTTGCINSDSINIIVNALPTLILNEGVYCQDAGKIDLDEDIVVSPVNTNLGTPSWECIECNGNDFSQMLVDEGPGGGSGILDWKILIDPDHYTLKNNDKDTIVLEFEYVNEKGCRSRDTVSIEIWKVPQIIFQDMEDLCFDVGDTSLNLHSGVNLTDGIWSCVDTTIGATTYSCAGLGGIANNRINTLNSSNKNLAGTYYLRYTHTSSGCPVYRDTTLTINPLPQISLTDIGTYVYCEDEANITLGANPTGGSWSSTDPSALVNGNQFSPSGATVHGADIWLTYSFTSPTTGCSNSDSFSIVVDPKPILNVPNDTIFCKPNGLNSTNLSFNVTGQNNNGIDYFSTNLFGSQSQYTLTETTAGVDVGINFNTQKSDTFRVIAYIYGQGECSDDDDYFDVVVHPLPEGRIVSLDSNGCQPVDADFSVVFSNAIDAANSTYAWDLDEEGTATGPNPSATYPVPGQKDITVTVTSERGCIAVFTNVIDVYPLPNAAFVPNPNNYTTAALPQFKFTDESTVEDYGFGSTITDWLWNFDDHKNPMAGSTDQHTSYRYSKDTTTYYVKLLVTTNYGCQDSIELPVVIGPDLTVYIPNAFTPDGAGPGENEGFKPLIEGEKSMEFIIFNRWGEIVFETTTRDVQWDGTYKGLPVQQDVYAYQLKVTALDDKPYTFSGTITVIR